MSQDVNRDRLERIRSDLAALRAAADIEDVAPPEPAAVNATSNGNGRAGHGVEAPEATPARSQEPAAARSPAAAAASSGRTSSTGPSADGTTSEAAHRPATTSTTAPTGLLGRPRIPKPPRRNPFRRRARRPSKRLAVPAPIPVTRRPVWLAAPRWPVPDAVSTTVIVLVMVPVIAQMASRLWVATNETSVLLGADPSRADALRAAAGVAGGGITVALAVFALAIVRGRPGYIAGGVAVLLLFVAFPYVAYTANAGIVSAPIPTLGEMVVPRGWPRANQLGAVFLLTAGALVAALVDLAYRSVLALREGVQQSRR